MEVIASTPCLRAWCANELADFRSAGQQVCGRRDKKFVESGRKSLLLGEIRDSFFVDHQQSRNIGNAKQHIEKGIRIALRVTVFWFS